MTDSKSGKIFMEKSKESEIDGKHKNHSYEILSQLVEESDGQEILINKKQPFNEEKNGIEHKTKTTLIIKIFFFQFILYFELYARSVSESKPENLSQKESSFIDFYKKIPLREDLIELSTTQNRIDGGGKLMLDLIPHSIKNRLDDKHKKIVIQFETENRPVIRIVEGKE